VIEEAGGPYKFELAWLGWRLKVDGKAARLGAPLALAPGSHAVELQGQVPAGASGPLPLRVVDALDQTLPQWQWLALDPRLGFRAVARQYPSTEAVTVQPLPYRRYQRPEAVGLPFSAEWTADLKVPFKGRYQFRVLEGYRTEMQVGKPGKRYTNSDGQTLSGELALEPGVKVPLKLNFQVEVLLWREWSQTVLVEVKGPGDEDFKPLPFDWVWLPD